MTTIDRANVDITATDKTAQAFKSAQQRVQQLSKSLQQAGQAMTVRMTAPIAAIGAGVLKTAGDFESAMNRVRAVSGASGESFDKLVGQAKELGRTTAFSASQAADAMGFLAMAGNDAQNIMSAMPATLQLASSAGVDLGTAADTVTNILAGFRLETEELSRANDVLVSAMTGSNTNLEQLGEALKYVGPVASSFGFSLEETTAALGMLGNAGIQASMAGTTLRGMLTRLANPSKDASILLNELSINAMNADGSMKPLAEILAQIERSGMSSAEAMEIFGQRAGPGVLALVGQGTEALVELQARLEESGGTAQRIADVQMQGFNGAMKSLASAAEGLGLALASSGLLDYATRFANELTEWVRVMSETDPEMLAMITGVGALAAALGPLLLVLGGATAALGALISPIGLVVVAITGLTAAWVAWGDEITAFVTDTHAAVVEWTAGVIESFMNLKDKAVGFVTDMVDGIRTALVDKLKSIGDAAGETIDSVTGFFADMWDAVVGHSFVPDMIDAIADEFARLPSVMVDPSRDATDSVTGFFDDMGSRVGSVIKGLLKGTTDLKSALRGLAEDYLERWIDRGVDSLFSGGDLGGYINGGGIGGGSGGGIGGFGGMAGIGQKVASFFGFGGGSTTSAVPGALGSVKGPAVLNYAGGASSAAAGNGFGGGLAGGGGNVAASGSAWGSAAGAAVVAAIAAYGFSTIGKKQQQRAERQAEFFTGVGTGTTENLGGSAWDFRGMLDDATAFFSTTREGWQSTVEALKEAGVAAQGWGASLDENGRGLVKIQGDIAGVKSALSSAVATGYDFVGSLSNAIEKGNNLRVSIQGDAEAIESALQAATAMGIGGFVGLEKTATGVSATLTGNIQLWDQYLQGFVNEAIGSAVNGVSALGGAASDATKDFLTLANAAARVKVGSTIGGGRSAQVDGSHSTGLPYVPRDGYVAELHRGERVLTAEQNRNLSRAGMDDTRMVKAIERQTQVIRRQGRRADYTLGGR